MIRRVKIRRIKVCPKCDSTDIRLDPFFWGGRIYQCRKCGFRSPLFPETPLEEIERRDKIKSKKKGRKSKY